MASLRLTLGVTWRPLDELENARGKRVGGPEVRKCEVCRGEGTHPFTEPWQEQEVCPACLGEGTWTFVFVQEMGPPRKGQCTGGVRRNLPQVRFRAYISRWLWELYVGEREISLSGDGPWSGDSEAWKGQS